MKEYHKINSIFKRDEKGRFITTEYSRPEFEFLRNCPWQWTEKVDGTNIRLTVENGLLRVGGRTDAAQIPTFLLDSINKLISVDSFKSVFPDCADLSTVTLYGEGYGARIQKGGGHYRSDTSFVLFDVLVGNWWLKWDDVVEVAQKLNIQHVPVVGNGTLSEGILFTREGYKSTWGDFMAEGIILKPEVDLFERGGHRIITKLKHKDFK